MVLYIIMGGMIAKSSKNYQLSYLARNKPTQLIPAKPNVPFYQTHLIKEEYEVPCYSLKLKKHINLEQLQAHQYQKPQQLRLLTYNVWFEGHNVENRYPIILQMLAQSGADVICLQEVNQQFLQLLHAPSGAYKQLEEYYIPNMKMHWYDTIILTRIPCKFYRKVFQSSSMGRCALAAVLQFSDGQQDNIKIGINCVHLQSLNNPEERINQLKQIETMNQNIDVSIIAGDFNFSDGWKEDKAIQGYTDLWKKGKRHFSKYSTEEQKKTGFTMPKNGRFPVWRPDHVIYRNKLKKEEQIKEELQIIGDFTVHPYEHQHYSIISQDGQVRTPSDHFGLLAKINL